MTEFDNPHHRPPFQSIDPVTAISIGTVLSLLRDAAAGGSRLKIKGNEVIGASTSEGLKITFRATPIMARLVSA